MATNYAVLTVALVTQSTAEVPDWTDALVVSRVCPTAACRLLVTAVSAFGTQLIALAGVLLNVVANVKVCRQAKRKCRVVPYSPGGAVWMDTRYSSLVARSTLQYRKW